MEKMGVDQAMHDFQEVLETLDVKTDSLNGAMEGVYSSSTSQTQVDELMQKLRDQQATDVNNQGVSIKSGGIHQEVKNEDDDLMARLKNLNES